MECLGQYKFVSIYEAQETVEAWQVGYSTYWPHRLPNHLISSEFAKRYRVTEKRSFHSPVMVDQETRVGGR